MRPTEHIANTASTTKIGLFAALGGVLPNKGSSAPARTFLVVTFLLASAAALTFSAAAAQAEAFPNEALRTGPSAHLPDCRAYEQVTPVDKQSGKFELEGTGPGAGGTPDMLIKSFSAIEGLKDDAEAFGGYYSITRTESGWKTEPLPPSATEYESVQPPGHVSPIMGESLDDRSALWLAHGDSQPGVPAGPLCLTAWWCRRRRRAGDAPGFADSRARRLQLSRTR